MERSKQKNTNMTDTFFTIVKCDARHGNDDILSCRRVLKPWVEWTLSALTLVGLYGILFLWAIVLA